MLGVSRWPTVPDTVGLHRLPSSSVLFRRSSVLRLAGAALQVRWPDGTLTLCAFVDGPVEGH